MPSSQNPLQPMLAAIAGETCAGFNSTSPEVIITLIIFDHLWSPVTILYHLWRHQQRHLYAHHHDQHYSHHQHHRQLLWSFWPLSPKLPPQSPQSYSSRCSRPLRRQQTLARDSIPQFQRCWLILFLSSSNLISCHPDLQKVIFQVDLAGAVLANSTVGAEELISWACDQYIGNILW